MKLDDLDALIADGYPRPRLVRPEWHDLSGAWELAYDDADVGLAQGWWRSGVADFNTKIEVPYPPESNRSGVADRSPHPVLWYRRRADVPLPASGERVLLHFGAVDYAATVWVNGALVGRHEGGHTPFGFDVTSEIEQSGARTGEMSIVVRAEDRAGDAHQPRGKQDWRDDPHRIWYHRTSGIWQPVWCEVVPAEHLVAASFATSLEDGLVSVDAEVAGAAEGARLSVRLWLGEELLGAAEQSIGGRHVRVPVPVPALENVWDRERLLWSSSSPTLLTVELGLSYADGRPGDTAWSTVGLRTVAARDGRFLVNGSPQYLRLVLSQGYWPDSHLAAPGVALRAEVELALSLGFNGVRVHQKLEDPRFLYWADRLGLMVWEEMPSAAAFSARATRRIVGEWTEAVLRDRDHPSIVTWVPFNESWGLPDLPGHDQHRHLASALYHLTLALDPTRPVISNDGWEHVESDIVGVHDYAPTGAELSARYGSRAALEETLHGSWPSARRVLLEGFGEQGQPVVLSEFGGVALAADPDPDWHGYSVARTSDELADRLEDLFGAVQDGGELAGFCYTQLVDTEQESNGLCWPDRTPKLPAERIRAIVSPEGSTDH
ncbi:MAG: glycoside hydrolase [Acidimicrobiaceae bacterium]|nr:glycoside hydrolase [Acidimicrobiaceae bacterium]